MTGTGGSGTVPRRALVSGVALVIAAAGWYWFRPERALIDRTVSEAAPAGAAADIVLRGSFHSNAHETRGTATVHRVAGGRLILRFTDFATLDGPDVQIYLVAAADVNDEADLRGGYVSLGPLKGNVGDQNYVLPPGIDLGAYRAVSVWCRRFGVNFGAAPLRAPDAS
jgi:hypothetical protein